jgi:hypothetical protein
MRHALLLAASVALALPLLSACMHAPESPCPSAFTEVVSPAPTNRAVPEAAAPRGAPSSPPPPPAVASSEPPAAFKQAISAAATAMGNGDSSGADHQLDAATKAAGDDLHLRYLVARSRATRFAYSSDFEAAAAALVSIIPELAKHPESPDEFWAHNGMMMIRESQGDPAAALAENDQATLAAARGSWEPEDRETLAYLKDRWHRAYLTRMLGETRAGSARQALVYYADAALADYRERARKLGSNEESIAVLEAYFAALDGNKHAALEAAKKVDPAKDDDLEDLYLVVVGLEAGGDHAAAEAVRQRMRRPGSVYLARPIMLRWIEQDGLTRGSGSFTPWHPLWRHER